MRQKRNYWRERILLGDRVRKYFSTDKETKLKSPQNSFTERVFRKLWGVVEVTLDS